MAKTKFDGIVEAVRYTPDGQIDWVRVYERRGAAFSDHVILQRQALIERLKTGKRFATGKRIEYHAGSFETGQTLRLVQRGGREIIATGEPKDGQDYLAGVPII